MTATVLHGDSLVVLAGLPDASVDAIVTDPPYGLEFMGKEWDSFGRQDVRQPGDPTFQQVDNPYGRGKVRYGTATSYGADGAPAMRAFQRWCQAWATEALRVLKPGGHLLAFGGTRTYHRLAAGIEDAGFEIRDSLHWIYGSGFPKSLDVSKAIDKAAGATREVVGRSHHPQYQYRRETAVFSTERRGFDDGTTAGTGDAGNITAPATPDAATWQGWGTALKPAHEPIVLARKPLVGTVAANVLAHGTGALNIDATRVAHLTVGTGNLAKNPHLRASIKHGQQTNPSSIVRPEHEAAAHVAGRWPSNLLLTHTPDCVHTGDRKVRGITGGTGNHDGAVYGARSNAGQKVNDYADADGTETVPAFDCAPGCPVAELDQQSGTKGPNGSIRGAGPRVNDVYGVDKRDRGDWTAYQDSGGASRYFPVFRYQAKAPTSERPKVDSGVAHPTVKPLALMRWLVRLACAPGGTVLDPFAGSGTTVEACLLEGVDCLAVEREADYLPLIQARIDRATATIEGTLL